MKGEANTSWTADKQQLNNEGRYENEQQLLTGHEEYFSIKYYVAGQASGECCIITVPDMSSFFPMILCII